MNQISGDWIRAAPTRAVMRALTEAGHQAFFVGGCVRNALLGKPVADIDIATSARPEVVMELTSAAGLRAIATGIEHGTVTVMAAHIPHEITTFRRDIQTDGRRAVVDFSDSIAEDARRRDFTMNALYADAGGTVLDPLNGFGDLAARRVRFIENATQRIREDYLRILRFFRFHAIYGDPDAGLDAEGLAACAANLNGIETISKERIGAEMKKLLAARNPAPAVAAMANSGVLGQVLPGTEARTLPILVHLESQLEVLPEPILRLAALGGQGQTEALRLSKAETRRLVQLRAASGESQPPAELGYAFGASLALDILLLRAASLELPLPENISAEAARGAAAVFPLAAVDLMPDFAGPALGKRLKHLESEWIASNFTLSRSELLS
ncbi:MAG: CCA tRNA nucleotidyltransferase [Halocynthiibacter sp.]